MNVNKVILAGNLTRDPELRYTNGGTPLAKFGLAVNQTYKDANGDKKQKATFVDVVAWGTMADVLAKHVAKGDPLFIEGRLEFSSWTDKAGQNRSKLEVTVESFQFVGPKRKQDAEEGVPF